MKIDEDDPLQLDEATMEQLLQDEQAKITNENILFRQSNPILNKLLNEPEVPKNRVIAHNEKDKKIISHIDYIVQSIANSIEENEPELILEILSKTSFNIANVYLYFSDKEKFKYLLFTDMEDYILRNMRSSEYYDNVLRTKGEELVEERERFLNIDY